MGQTRNVVMCRHTPEHTPFRAKVLTWNSVLIHLFYYSDTLSLDFHWAAIINSGLEAIEGMSKEFS
jgi:hypothetical protein